MSSLEQEKINSLVIAAGFGVRMNAPIPKGLIEVDGKPIMARMLEDLTTIRGLGQIAIITNARYFSVYRNWLNRWKRKHGINNQRIRLINNHVMEPDKRLGALGDVWRGAEILKLEEEPFFVWSSDTAYLGSLDKFVDFAINITPPCFVTAVYQLERENIAGRLGCVVMDSNQIIRFEEKPLMPFSDYAIAPFYFYSAGLLDEIELYNKAGGSLDAPSSIIKWFLDKRIPVYGYQIGTAVDVGTPPDIGRAQVLIRASALV